MTTSAVKASQVTEPGPSPIERLWDEDHTRAGGAVRGSGMPAELERRYGGSLAISLRHDRPTVVANFVTTLDGVVAFGGGDLSGGGLVSGFFEPDRFVMGLLRAVADLVVVGAGTLRGSSEHRWTPDYIHPPSATAFAAWRAAMGLAERPTTVIVTGSGELPVEHPALRDSATPITIATTPAGGDRLRSVEFGEHVEVAPVGSGSHVAAADLIDLAARLEARLVLTEGGPHLLGELVRADRLDELFLTESPQLVGRGFGERIGLVEGLALQPSDGRWHQLVSVRRAEDHLFLRYRRNRETA